MKTLFSYLLDNGLNMSLFLLIIFILRYIIKNNAKEMRCYLWTVVFLRFLCPVSILDSIIKKSSFSTYSIPFVERVTADLNHSLSFHPVTLSLNQFFDINQLLFEIWLLGFVVMIGYAILSYLFIKKKVQFAIQQEDFWLCDEIESPFILGIYHPRILIPSFIQSNELSHVLAHEKAHLYHYDHLIKPIGYFLLSINWMNPLFWIAYHLFSKDIELACDERVIHSLNQNDKNEYAQTLLSLSISQDAYLNCPVAFAETSVLERVKNVLSFKKKTTKVSLIVLVGLLVVGGWLVTSSSSQTSSITENDEINQAIRQVVLEANGIRGKSTDTRYYAESHEILAIEESNEQVVFYINAMFATYDFNDHHLTMDYAGSNPAILSFKKVDHQLELILYWQPQSGENYASSIRKKFPSSTWEKVFSNSDALDKNCLHQAYEYFNISK